MKEKLVNLRGKNIEDESTSTKLSFGKGPTNNTSQIHFGPSWNQENEFDTRKYNEVVKQREGKMRDWRNLDHKIKDQHGTMNSTDSIQQGRNDDSPNFANHPFLNLNDYPSFNHKKKESTPVSENNQWNTINTPITIIPSKSSFFASPIHQDEEPTTKYKETINPKAFTFDFNSTNGKFHSQLKSEGVSKFGGPCTMNSTDIEKKSSTSLSSKLGSLLDSTKETEIERKENKKRKFLQRSQITKQNIWPDFNIQQSDNVNDQKTLDSSSKAVNSEKDIEDFHDASDQWLSEIPMDDVDGEQNLHGNNTENILKPANTDSTQGEREKKEKQPYSKSDSVSENKTDKETIGKKKSDGGTRKNQPPKLSLTRRASTGSDLGLNGKKLDFSAQKSVKPKNNTANSEINKNSSAKSKSKGVNSVDNKDNNVKDRVLRSQSSKGTQKDEPNQKLLTDFTTNRD